MLENISLKKKYNFLFKNKKPVSIIYRNIKKYNIIEKKNLLINSNLNFNYQD